MKKFLLPLVLLISIMTFIPKPAVSCEIGEIGADVLPCNDDGDFYVLLDFEYAEVGNDGFRVQGNGNNYGNFSYEDLPVEIGPLEGDGETVYEFVVIDNQFGDCSNWTAIDPVDCENGGGECNIWDAEADVNPCNEEGFFTVMLDFEYYNVGSDGFHVQGNGTNYGNFSYEDIPVEIGPLEGDGVTVYEFIVTDNQIEGCSDWTGIDPVDCEGSGSECGIGELDIEVLDCNDDGYFMCILDFEYENVSEAGFNAYVNNEYFGNYSYSQLPVEIGPLEGDGETIYNFFVVDSQFEDCHRWDAIDPVECEEGGDECEIDDMEVDVLPCNEAGNFFVLLDFEYENVSEEGFKLWINGDLYESYDYTQLPIEVGPFEGDGETAYHFLVRDIIYENCAEDLWIDPVDCDNQGSCWMGEMEVEIEDCNDDNAFFAVIEFQYGNVSGDGFNLYVNDDLYGTFAYEELPLEVGPLSGDGVTAYSFFAGDFIFEGCNTYSAIDPVDCEEGDGANASGEQAMLYPNPVKSNGQMQLSEELDSPVNIYLYDLHGNEVLRRETFSEKSFSLPALDSGIYFYKIDDSGKTLNGKFSVE